MRTALLATIAAAFLLGGATPALSHAERAASTPKEGAAMATAPKTLKITFTEPPTGDAVVEILDGCGNDVLAGLEVQNFEITAALGEGQPGKWEVRTNVISGVDGHNTRDRWSFDVRGEPDCSAPETPGPDASGEDLEPDDEGGGSLPLIALGGATVLLIALGLFVRGRSS